MKRIPSVEEIVEEYRALTEEERETYPHREIAEFYIGAKENPLSKEEERNASDMGKKMTSGLVPPSDTTGE